jgi:hypothetical protein
LKQAKALHLAAERLDRRRGGTGWKVLQ